MHATTYLRKLKRGGRIKNPIGHQQRKRGRSRTEMIHILRRGADIFDARSTNLRSIDIFEHGGNERLSYHHRSRPRERRPDQLLHNHEVRPQSRRGQLPERGEYVK